MAHGGAGLSGARYVAAGPGRVALESYYSSDRRDFWVVGSTTSKAEALRKGYVLVGTVGYGLALAH